MRAPCAGLSSLLVLACCAAPQPAPAEVVAEPEPLPESVYVGLMIAAIDAYEREEYALAEDTADAALRLRPDDELARDVLVASRKSGQGTNGSNSLALEAYVADRKREFAERRAALGPCAAAREEAPDGSFLELIRAAVDAFCREDLELAETHATAALRLRPDDPLASDVLMDSRKARHVTMGRYLDDQKKRRYREACDALGPPAPP